MRTTRLQFRAVWPVAAACLGLPLASCSRASDDLAEPSAATTVIDDAVASTAVDPTDGRSIDPSIVSSIDPASPSSASVDATPVPTEATTALTVGSVVTVAELPEVGVPGLDSTDAFCASWSRFAGSFQVVAVTAAFGSGPPEQLASLEVAASPVVTEAYDDLLANWPDELSSEADLVADEFLGPFARRLRVARDSLDSVGAGPAEIEAISAAWLAGLAGRDPSTPEFTVDLSDESWAVIDGAALDFGSRLVPFSADPSLVTEVSTPLTDEYLAASCPDQGTLSGQEVDAP